MQQEVRVSASCDRFLLHHFFCLFESTLFFMFDDVFSLTCSFAHSCCTSKKQMSDSRKRELTRDDFVCRERSILLCEKCGDNRAACSMAEVTLEKHLPIHQEMDADQS